MTRKLVFVTALLLLAFVWAGCYSFFPLGSTVTGTVTDRSGTPIGGAQVKLAGRQTTTAADGSYEFRGIRKRSDYLSVMACGYEPYDQTVTIAPGPQVMNVSMLAAVPINISGIVNSNGTPKASWNVLYEDETGGQTNTMTNGSGEYTFLSVDAYCAARVEVRGDATGNTEVEFAQYNVEAFETDTDIALPDVDIYYGGTVTPTPDRSIPQSGSASTLATAPFTVEWDHWTPVDGTAVTRYSFEVQDVTSGADPIYVTDVSVPTSGTAMASWDGSLDDGGSVSGGGVTYDWVAGYELDSGWFGHLHQHGAVTVN